ncbi:MAG TPA: hypothetical protein VFA74_09245 [Terriglobales bacterium]|nr:hypothetical protein [Terriglobales bacterium]
MKRNSPEVGSTVRLFVGTFGLRVINPELFNENLADVARSDPELLGYSLRTMPLLVKVYDFVCSFASCDLVFPNTLDPALRNPVRPNDVAVLIVTVIIYPVDGMSAGWAFADSREE